MRYGLPLLRDSNVKGHVEIAERGDDTASVSGGDLDRQPRERSVWHWHNVAYAPAMDVGKARDRLAIAVGTLAADLLDLARRQGHELDAVSQDIANPHGGEDRLRAFARLNTGEQVGRELRFDCRLQPAASASVGEHVRVEAFDTTAQEASVRGPFRAGVCACDKPFHRFDVYHEGQKNLSLKG